MKELLRLVYKSNYLIKLSLIVLVTFFLINCLKSGETPSSPNEGNENQQDRWIGLFSGRGTWDEGLEFLRNVIVNAGFQYREIDMNSINENQLEGCWLLIIPGGRAYWYAQDINDNGVSNIRNRVNEGMAYLGICAGAYFATENVIWNGNQIDYPLKIYKGTAVGPLYEIDPERDGVTTEVNIYSHPLNGQHTGLMEMYYYDGPKFLSSDYLATYSVIQEPAIVFSYYGKGMVLLSGVHPEVLDSSQNLLITWLNYLFETSTQANIHIRDRKANNLSWLPYNLFKDK